VPQIGLFEQLQPDELALRDWVRTHMNASIVRDIAEHDYGMHAEDYQYAIEELMAARRLPAALDWMPGEVISLASYSPVPDRNPAPGSDGWRAHVKRLFCCLLLTATGHGANPAEPVAELVDSALELGPEPTALAVRFLAWCRLNEPGDWRFEEESRPFLTLGMLLLSGDPRLRAAFMDEVRALVPVEQWWKDDTPSAALREAAGGSGFRLWRAIADRRLPAADTELRAWLRLGR
jgi:hypothetical protein